MRFVTPDYWEQVVVLFERARERASSERSALLDEACKGDASLRREVESLLAVYDATGERDAERLAGMADSAGLESTLVAEGRRSSFAKRAAGTLVGATLDGKYRLEALLGRGGMGEVYRATHLQLEREVAVKTVCADDPTEVDLDRFWREARMIARLRHPNIVTIHDYGVAPGVGAYFVMERLVGRSLRAELRERQRYSVSEALAIVGQVCGAIAAAHRAGVVHRDLNPDNIFLEPFAPAPSVKVLDFGLAKLAESTGSAGATVTKRGDVIGTPAYMSPEQCKGEEVGTGTDVYAIGCILYEMLTGRVPFLAPAPFAILYKHVHEPPVRPRALAPEIDSAVEAAILKALAKDPADRYRSAEELARALGARPEAIERAGGATTGEVAVDTGAVAGVSTEGPAGATNLRNTLTRFVGRERETADLREWLARTRLVTLVGPGGIGKTRLAAETAAQLLGEYADGVWLVELAGLADPALVDQAVASALGVREQGGQSIGELLAEELREKRMLLVVDNCEHLVEACARLAERLLESAPELRILATSREALGVAGEAVWAVPALSTAGDEGASEAAALFVDRASLARPGFELTDANRAAVGEICRRLEGLPLAIELAAARVKVLSVGEILTRLDDRFALLASGSRTASSRQRTLRGAIAWSYDLLTESEQAALRRVAVFAGGWTLDAAVAVVGDELGATSLELLFRLVDKSLVRAEERGRSTRYRMLEMIREFGLDELELAGEAEEVGRRHAGYFRSWAEVAREEIRSGPSAEWLDALEEEHDNVRAALGWLVERDPAGCLQLVVAVNRFRALRGYFGEARRWVESALARAAEAPASLRVTALREAGFVAMTQGDLAAARAFYERGLEVAREGGAELRIQMAVLVQCLGDVAQMEGDLATARERFGESLAIGREAANDLLIASSLNSLGELAREEGDWEAAEELYSHAIAIGRRVNNEPMLISFLCNAGAAACERGELDVAAARCREALSIAEALRSGEYIALSVDGLAAIASKRGAWARAVRLGSAVEALLDEAGARLGAVDRAFHERYLASAREHLDDTSFETARAEGREIARRRAWGAHDE
jgi:non-specific serine/threonine protein kinase